MDKKNGSEESSDQKAKQRAMLNSWAQKGLCCNQPTCQLSNTAPVCHSFPPFL